MKISELITRLEKIKDKEGDLRVMGSSPSGIKDSDAPQVKHLRILSKRESRQGYWEKYFSNCTPENKGEKVVHI